MYVCHQFLHYLVTNFFLLVLSNGSENWAELVAVVVVDVVVVDVAVGHLQLLGLGLLNFLFAVGHLQNFFFLYHFFEQRFRQKASLQLIYYWSNLLV